MSPSRILRRLAAPVLLISCALAVPASAHYKVAGEEDDPYGRWYFTGMTYDGRPDDGGHRKDPLNVIFYGTSDTSPYTRDRIEQHMKDDWSTRAVGGRRWSVDSDIIGICKDDQYVGWYGYPGFDSDKSDWHGSTSGTITIPSLPVPVTKTACYAQHHLRMWDDWEHTKLTTGHTRWDWAVGGIHHEHPISKINLDPRHLNCCVRHRIDRDWDRVRVEMIKAMATHCSVRRWKYHAEADGIWQGYENSGYIARISLRHASQGCDGA